MSARLCRPHVHLPLAASPPPRPPRGPPELSGALRQGSQRVPTRGRGALRATPPSPSPPPCAPEPASFRRHFSPAGVALGVLWSPGLQPPVPSPRCEAPRDRGLGVCDIRMGSCLWKPRELRSTLPTPRRPRQLLGVSAVSFPPPPGTRPWPLAWSGGKRGAAYWLLASGVMDEVQGAERTRWGFGGAPAHRHAPPSREGA